MITTRQEFFKAQARIDNVSFNQTEAWLDSRNLKESQCVFVLDDIGYPQLGCWGVVHKNILLGDYLIIAGESMNNNVSSHQIRKFYSEIYRLGFNFVKINNYSFYNIDFEIGIRRAGFLRPMIKILSPLTLVISANHFNQKDKTWNRNIRLATQAKLSFCVVEKPTNHELDIFCELFQDLKVNKKLPYTISSSSLIKLFQSNSYKLFFVYNEEQVPVSGRIIYVHADLAYDVYAANSDESRSVGAAYFIIDSIMDYLKNKGVSFFDYGTITPSNAELDHIYQSKSHSGGTPQLYNGQWVHYQSKWIEYCLNAYYLFFSKNERF
ncbi:hypothetical protein V7S76_11365 [Aquirufa sp. ROCK2-A2]